jgi:large subunit ribosomal protein L6
MSKIGRKPIDIGSVAVEVKGNEIIYKGPKASGIYEVPPELTVKLTKKLLTIEPQRRSADMNRVWGLHRALLFNTIKGAEKDFEKQLRINGLGFKATVSGNKVQLSLGFSHKIDFELPKNVILEVDKTGQLLTLKSPDKTLLGLVASKIRALRPPEPYKGTGIQYANEIIRRKAGKAKSA